MRECRKLTVRPGQKESDIHGVCPLCEGVFLRAQLQVQITKEPPTACRQITKAIQAEFSSWKTEDGACSQCWESFRGVARVVDFMKKFKSPTGKRRMKSRLSSRLSGLIPPLTLVLLIVLVGCGRQPAAQPQKIAVQTKRVESMENLRPEAEASYIAIVRAENETDLSFKVGGILDLIGDAKNPGHDWDEGASVKEGEVLASLKQSNFTNDLSSAQAKEDLAKKVRDRFSKLLESKTISQQEMDETEASWLSAQARLNQAKQDLQDSQLRAPVSGVVLARYVNSGVTVNARQPVLRFADISKMSVELGVPDRLIKYFKVGKKLGVEISAFEGHPPFPGEVSEVGVAASQEGRLFRIVIKVPNPDGRIRSGMTATVRIGDPERFAPGEVGVPLSALVTFSPAGQNEKTDPSQLAVFVVTDGKAIRRPVKTGDIFSSSIVVKEGLKAGEEVVTAGASFLYDGAPVEVLENRSATD